MHNIKQSILLYNSRRTNDQLSRRTTDQLSRKTNNQPSRRTNSKLSRRMRSMFLNYALLLMYASISSSSFSLDGATTFSFLAPRGALEPLPRAPPLPRPPLLLPRRSLPPRLCPTPPPICLKGAG